jgi:cytochrome oxidase Cu insertion factor (SCO1/SenC/PrrC family)
MKIIPVLVRPRSTRPSSFLPALLGLIALCACAPATLMAQTLGGVDAPEIPPYSSKSTVLPPILKGINFEQRLGSQIPLDATFQDENGKTVQLGSYFGKKPVVLILAYYRCPMLCTLVMDGAARAFKQLSFDLGDQFDALTVSFDPRDTPANSRNEQAKYVKVYGHPDAASSWHFLTGQTDQIKRLTDSVGFHYAYDPRTGQYVHTAGIFLRRDVRSAILAAGAGAIIEGQNRVGGGSGAAVLLHVQSRHGPLRGDDRPSAADRGRAHDSAARRRIVHPASRDEKQGRRRAAGVGLAADILGSKAIR